MPVLTNAILRICLVKRGHLWVGSEPSVRFGNMQQTRINTGHSACFTYIEERRYTDSGRMGGARRRTHTMLHEFAERHTNCYLQR